MSDSAEYISMCSDQQSGRINFVSSDNRLALTAPIGSSVQVPTNPVAWNTLSYQDKKNSVEVSPLPMSHTIRTRFAHIAMGDTQPQQLHFHLTDASPVPGPHLCRVLLERSAGAEGGRHHYDTLRGGQVHHHSQQPSYKALMLTSRWPSTHAKAADDRPALAVKVNIDPAEQATSDLYTFAQETFGMAFSTLHSA